MIERRFRFLLLLQLLLGLPSSRPVTYVLFYDGPPRFLLNMLFSISHPIFVSCTIIRPSFLDTYQHSMYTFK